MILEKRCSYVFVPILFNITGIIWRKISIEQTSLYKLVIVVRALLILYDIAC